MTDIEKLDAEIRVAAAAAGMDPRYTRYLPKEGVSLNECGEAIFPESYWDDARKAHPKLFGTAADAGRAGSSSGAPAPAASPPGSRHARDMTQAEYEASLAKLTRG